MNKLLIYYSVAGYGDQIADYLKGRGHPSLKLDFKKPIVKMSFFKTIRYGWRAIREKSEELAPYEFDANKFDEIYMGCPIWAGRLATPFLSFLQVHPEIAPKVKAVFLCSASGKIKKADEQLKRFLPHAEVVSLASPKSCLDEMKRKVSQTIL